jgi:hypothetical protein
LDDIVHQSNRMMFYTNYLVRNVVLCPLLI